jgi:nucleotide-binding universal stress UspA family protein
MFSTGPETHVYDNTDGSILVGIDGSPNAAIAAAWALAIGRRTNSPVKAVAVWTEHPPPQVPGVDDLASEGHSRTVDIATRSLHDAGLEGVEVTAVQGPVAEKLLDTADALGAAMLVVGTRGLGPLSGLLLGSISRRLLFTTHRPLVVVPCRSTPHPPVLSRVVVGVDCSMVAERVLSWSVAFCADLGVPATIVRCADPGCERPPGHVAQVDDRVIAETEEAVRSFRDRGVEYRIVVAHCDPRVALLDTAAGDEAGLIVVGRLGEGQFRGLGGTASYLVRHSPVPLAVIPDSPDEGVP